MRRPTTSRELTARVNDEGWDTAFSSGSRARGSAAATRCSCSRSAAAASRRKLSRNLVAALDLPAERCARSSAIVGRDGGYTGKAADACVVIPPLVAEHVTPHTEGLCAVIWHLLVSHPALQQSAPEWESRG